MRDRPPTGLSGSLFVDPAERAAATIKIQTAKIAKLTRERDEARVQLATARDRIKALERQARTGGRLRFGPDGEDELNVP